VLRVETQARLQSVDPAVVIADAGNAWLRDAALSQVFETLVTVTPDGIRPALATSWTRDADGTRWRFVLRRGVRLHDNTLLDSTQAASSLRASLADAAIASESDVVTIETRGDRPALLWELAEPGRSIVVRASDGRLLGTGPFRIDRLEPSRLAMAAHDRYWGGRAFVDGVRIEFDRPLAAQLTGLETGRADLVTVQPTDARRLAQRELRLSASLPIELAALVFEPHRAARSDVPLRRALAAAVNRDVVVRVLLQDYAAPAAALLPSWLTGYPASLVAADTTPVARNVIAGLPADRRTLVLRVAAGDPVARAIAERVAVDAREAGFLMTVQAPTGLAPRADVRLIRVPLSVTSPERSLAALMGSLGSRTLLTASRVPAPQPGVPVEAVARVERALLEPFVIVPLVHLPIIAATGERVEIFAGSVARPTGGWNLADVWLQPSSGPPSGSPDDKPDEAARP
jgi:ABC-type transport system substrate-binding protein